MNLRLGDTFADAGALWRSERELLLTVAAVFLFLPALGFGLLVIKLGPLPQDAPPDAAWNLMMQFLQQNWEWMLGSMLFQEFGTLALMLLLFEPGRTVGHVLGRALSLLPAYLLLGLMVWAVIALGSMLFILPGLYAMGRVFLAGPAFAANPGRGPVGALETSLRLSHRHGWMLAGMWLLIIITAELLTMLVPDPSMRGAASVAVVAVDMVVRMLIAAIGAGAVIAGTLVRVAAYRRLGDARQGI